MLDARDAKAPPRFEVKVPAGAPNVLIVLVDDMGFGMPSAFGGRCAWRRQIASPAGDCVSINSTPPHSARSTRTALLSGRNHHMNNMGSITENRHGFPAIPGSGQWRRAAGRNVALEWIQHRLLRQEP